MGKSSQYLVEKNLNLTASTDLKASVVRTDHLIASTLTKLDIKTNFYMTSVENVISQVYRIQPNECMVVKSTIPIDFIDYVGTIIKINAVNFSPEVFKRWERAV